jgi:antitoxin CptB
LTGSARSSNGLDSRRRRALYRAWHRGMREVDLLLGRFADAHIDALDNHDLADFEALMDVPDDLLLTWLTGQAPAAASHETRILKAILAFHRPPDGTDR